MPAHLLQAMPMLVFGLMAWRGSSLRGWYCATPAARRRSGPSRSMGRPRLAASWFAIWGVLDVRLDDRSDQRHGAGGQVYLPAIGAMRCSVPGS